MGLSLTIALQRLCVFFVESCPFANKKGLFFAQVPPVSNSIVCLLLQPLTPCACVSPKTVVPTALTFPQHSSRVALRNLASPSPRALFPPAHKACSGRQIGTAFTLFPPRSGNLSTSNANSVHARAEFVGLEQANWLAFAMVN